MIAGVKAEELFSIVPSRGTTYKDVRKMLRHYGKRGGPRRKYQGDFPDITVIARIWWNRNHSHWVVVKDRKVYCPGASNYLHLLAYNMIYANGVHGHFTSFMTVQ